MRTDDWDGRLDGAAGWLRLAVFGGVTGALLGVVGFISGDLLICLFDWTCMIVFGTLVAGLLIPRLMRMGRRLRLPVALSLGLAVLISAAPIGGLAAGFGYWAWPRVAGRLSIWDWYVETALVEALVTGLWIALQVFEARLKGRRRPVAVTVAATPLAQGETGGVTCLQVEDHYVRVHRPSGSSLELMPLKTAISRYGCGDGVRVHRSWWVARSAIDTVERDGRNWRVRLNTGLVVPVARNRLAVLRQVHDFPVL